MDKKSGGFTLVELILVIAILGIIATIAVPRLMGFRSRAGGRTCLGGTGDVSMVKGPKTQYIA